jgi:hypothetical protein
LLKHRRFAGVSTEGEISELYVGLKGTMNAMFLKDLAKKTHRGLRGGVAKGKASNRHHQRMLVWAIAGPRKRFCYALPTALLWPDPES